MEKSDIFIKWAVEEKGLPAGCFQRSWHGTKDKKRSLFIYFSPEQKSNEEHVGLLESMIVGCVNEEEVFAKNVRLLTKKLTRLASGLEV